MRKLLFAIILLLQPFPCAAVDVETISNGLISLSFSKADGTLTSFKNLRTGREMIDGAVQAERIWELSSGSGSPVAPGQTYAEVKRIGSGRLLITWRGKGGFEVAATVWLDAGKPLSYWQAGVKGIAGIDAGDFCFPVISRLKDQGGEQLAMSTWLGSLDTDPRGGINAANPARNYQWDSPGGLAMQMVALYSRDRSSMLYFSTQDTASYSKAYRLGLTQGHTRFAVVNRLPRRSGIDAFDIPYCAVVGLTVGDWLTAAQMYREWATGQRWCRESRFKRGAMPAWARQTALWVWNRGRSENVLAEAVAMRRRTGLPVSVLWHWWHGCPYDVGFPEYLPPREGRRSFVDAVARARRKGVNAIVYMNSYQWGSSTGSFKAENAARYAARRIDGTDYSHVFNIFTGKALTPMCLATRFWQDKYAGLADTVVNSYGVGGVYMDQACSNLPCYDATHGHTPGGGNYWVGGFGSITRKIRTATRGRRPALGGEGSGEDWMPYLDLFLTLEASRERYMGSGSTETVPLYQAVYHDYAVTFGSYSSLTYPPYDDLWPAEFRPSNREQPLPDKFNSQFRMEQARAFVWGMQPTIANWHESLAVSKRTEADFLVRIARVRQKALKYLLYGVMVRPPEISVPVAEIPISQISIYAGRTGSTVRESAKRVPLVYCGAWRSGDGNIAVALASISDGEVPVRFDFRAEDYGVRPLRKATMISEAGRKAIARADSRGHIPVSLAMPPRGVAVIEFTRR